MICKLYENYYITLASSVLVSLSIFAVIGIYLLQQRSAKCEEIEKGINNLNDLINGFYEMEVWPESIAIYRRLPSLKGINFGEMVHDVLDKYNAWKRSNGKINPFLVSLCALEDRLQLILIRGLDIFLVYDIFENTYKCKLSMDNFEYYRDRIFPYLDRAMSLSNMLTPGLIEEYRENRPDHDYGYWNSLLDIRSKTIEIDGMMKNYYQNPVNPVLKSSESKWLLLCSVVGLFLFGFITPIYMIQPYYKLGFLCCDQAFYYSLIFLGISLVVFPLCAVKNRYKYRNFKLEEMIKTIKSHNDYFYRTKKVYEMIYFGEEAVEPLKAVLDDNTQEKEVRLAAMGALVKLNKYKYIYGMLDLLNDKDEHIRSRAINVLGDTRDQRAVDPIINILRISDSERKIKFAALQALSKIGGQKAKETLEYCAENDSDDNVKKVANDMLSIYFTDEYQTY